MTGDVPPPLPLLHLHGADRWVSGGLPVAEAVRGDVGMVKVLVCGGRDFVMTDRYASAFHDIVGRVGATVVIHGAARGADIEAGKLALARGLTVVTFPADWKAHGRAAGPIRNQQMIDEGKPDLVVAFPGGAGTADMVQRAGRAGIKVIRPSP